MSLSRFDDGALWHPKAVEAGEDAANLWIRSIMYANRYNTDGLIRTGAVAGFTTKPPKVVAALAAALVAARLWDEVPGVGWRIHDFLDWNDSRDEKDERAARISEERSKAGKAGNAKRWGSRPDRKTIANGSQVATACDIAKSQSDRPYHSVPSPVPTEENPPTPASGGDGGPKPAVETAKPKRQRAPRVVVESDPDPLPFTIDAALSAIAGSSDGKFIVPRGAEFGGTRHVRALTDLIRGIPDIDAWARVGRWLASGAMDWKTDRGLRWFLTSDAFALSRQWEESQDTAPAANDARPGEAAFLAARAAHAAKVAALATQPTLLPRTGTQ